MSYVEAKERAQGWLNESFDAPTREQVQSLLDGDPKELEDAFGGYLEFGTGGMRGLMGAGTNRMNVYTVGQATQGLADYLLGVPELAGRPLSVAIAHDSRVNSTLFSEVAADVLTSNGIRVYLYEGVRPTPQLSFTVRNLHCAAGIVVTASHNPKEYNGYKVYWGDGAQVVAPHDEGIMAAVAAVCGPSGVKRGGGADLLVRLSAEMNEPYLAMLLSGFHRLDVVRAQRDMGIVYTPIHGSGGAVVREALHRMGFARVEVVASQIEPDGQFPTVVSPNPEDPAAMALALDLAERCGAELVLANDPDVDRLGVYVRDGEGAMRRLDGNQIVVLLSYYLCLTLKERGKLPENGFLVSTIVTSPLMDAIAGDFGLKIYHELTGFKHIAARIARLEGSEEYVGGGEESHGYLIGDSVRDKDGVQACMAFAEMAAWCRSEGRSVMDLLDEVYSKYGVMGHGQVSLVRKGVDGAREIASIMDRFRSTPPQTIDGERVESVADYRTGERLSVGSGAKEKLGLPSSNVLQWRTEGGVLVTVRPSGTEPKIKFYACATDESGSLEGAQARVERILGEVSKG